MKRFPTLVAVAAVSVALHGQQSGYPSAPGQSQRSQAQPQDGRVAQGASVSAELTKRLDTKRTKVGDAVEAKVTDRAKLPDGTELPRGTKLVGKVTDVRASSKEEKQAHLAFNLDHAVLKNGQQVAVHAALVSVTAPAPTAAAAPMSSGGGSMPSGGGESSSGAGSAGSAPSAPTPAATAPMTTSSQPTVQGGSLQGGQDHVPVGNLPGVMLSAASDANSAGSLDAAGQNISLESGTKLTLNLSAGA
jgi:hypothetical protein